MNSFIFLFIYFFSPESAKLGVTVPRVLLAAAEITASASLSVVNCGTGTVTVTGTPCELELATAAAGLPSMYKP